MSDPQPLPLRTQRLDILVSESGIQLNLTTDSRIEQLRCYQHWTLKDLDTLSGITEFSEIMCAVEWLQHTLTVDLEALVSSLYLYDLETLTVRELLLHLGMPAAILDVAAAQRTVPEYVQTAYNAFHLQSEYQDDLAATDELMEQLRNYAGANDIDIIQPYNLCEAAMSLRMVLLARGYPTVELGLTLCSETTVGEVPLDSLSETLTLRVKQTPESLRVTLWPETGPSTVLEIPGKVAHREYYIGGLDALQMEALEAALRIRTQEILSRSSVSAETATLRTLISQVWSLYVLPFQEYTARPAAVKQLHRKELHPLAIMLRAALWQECEDIYQQYADKPLTLVVECQKVIKGYLQERVENAVYSYGRLAYLAQDVSTVIAAALADEYQWTEAQNAAARADGWLVYDVGHDHFPERDRYRLQAFDQSGRFETDEQAWVHVVQQSQADPSGLSAQALAFLQRHAPREHRLVWVSAYQTMVKEALQTPDAFLQWIQIQEARRVIGWRLLEAFLGSLGVPRSQAGADYVWLYYWDETDPIAVLGLDQEGQPLADAPMPQWLLDFDREMETVARNTEEPPTAMGLFHYVNRVLPD